MKNTIMENFGEIFNYTTDSDLNYISFEINNPSPAYQGWDINGYFLWIYDGPASPDNRNRVTYIPITGNAVAWNPIKNLFGSQLDKFELEKWLKNHMNITLEYLN
tara:strand:- start:1433 stop:1747 length:315 start_codon:yes stop_codon:yes gene_type:complete